MLYIDAKSKHYPYVYTDDRSAVEQITDHLIDFHGYRNIVCLAAPASVSSAVRVAGFKDSLKKHRIEFKDSMVSHEGDFYYSGGVAFAKKIINQEISKPDAVLCINDYMAIGLIRELEKNGFKVPADIAVTGYDATEEAAIYSTVITTYAPPVRQTGIKAVCELSRLMTGVLPEPCKLREGRLEVGRSCGCNDMELMKRSVFQRLKEKAEDYKLMLESYMAETLTAVTRFEDCIVNFCYYLYLIRGYSDYYLCLCKNWDGSVHNYSEEQKDKLKVGYTDKMNLVLAMENKEFVNSDFAFDTKLMIPDLWKDRDKPKAYYFTPVHFNDNTLGYSVLTYGDKVNAYGITYRSWSRNVMNALEYNRAHRKLYRSSFRDVLTGIYNRRGLEQNLPELIHEVLNQEKKLMIIMADLDNLKTVNDSYGHKEGDNVISVVANAFQGCCKNNDICARIGGDEFLFAGIEEGSNRGECLMKAVKYYINDYNKKSKKPYQIEISMGACSEYINSSEDIELMFERADHKMYLNKAMNKRNRNKKLE